MKGAGDRPVTAVKQEPRESTSSTREWGQFRLRGGHETEPDLTERREIFEQRLA